MEDELEVLESIFEPSTIKINADRKSGLIQVPVSVPDDSSNSFLKHLSPIKLKFTSFLWNNDQNEYSTIDYPETAPLKITLQSNWLNYTNNNNIKTLENHINSKIFDNDVMLYDTYEFLTEELFETIKIDLEQLEKLPEIIDFNEYELHRDFEKEEQTCGVCFTDFEGKYCLYNTDCKEHVYCKACAKQYCVTKIEERKVSIENPFPKCMWPGCEKLLLRNTKILHDLIGNKNQEKYNLILLECLMRNEDVHYCPRITCNAPTVLEDKTDITSLRCTACPFLYCTRCRQCAHNGFCKLGRTDLKKILKAYEEDDQAVIKVFEIKYGLSEFRRILDEAKSEALLDKTSKGCPSCGTRIQKNMGCNKMQCLHCNTEFCWLCGLNLRSYKDAYHHFNPLMYPNSDCANKLFDGLTNQLEFDENFDEEDFAADLYALQGFI